MAGRMDSLHQETQIIIDKSKELEDRMALARKIRVFRSELIGVRFRGNGVPYIDDRIRKLKKFEVEFDVQENPVAVTGERVAYVIITTPGKIVLNSDQNQTFDFMGVQRLYTTKKAFSFRGKGQRVIAEFDITDPLPKGLYTAEIFIDGELVSTAKNTFR